MHGRLSCKTNGDTLSGIFIYCFYNVVSIKMLAHKCSCNNIGRPSFYFVLMPRTAEWFVMEHSAAVQIAVIRDNNAVGLSSLRELTFRKLNEQMSS